MNFEPVTLRDVIYIASIICGCVTTFFTTKHGLKESFRDMNDKLVKEINELKVQQENLKGKINLAEYKVDNQQFVNKEFIEGLLRLKNPEEGPKRK